MCGIFGVIAAKESSYSNDFLKKVITELGKLSQTRGKDSSGLCSYNPISNKIDVIKGPVPISKLLQTNIVKSAISNAFHDNNSARYCFGHARLVTNGSQLNDDNNQPVVKDGLVAVHNGIVVNVDELWKINPDINRSFEIDTEVMLSLLRKYSSEMSLRSSVSKMVKDVFGTVATATVLNDIRKFVLATNNGSLYTIKAKDIMFFASEKFMLSEFEKKVDLSSIGQYKIEQLTSNTGLLLDLDTFDEEFFKFEEDVVFQKENKVASLDIETQTIRSEKAQRSTVVDLNYIHLNPNAEKEQAILDYPIDKIKSLRRCTTCLLPETFPFIHYHEDGECNYCKNYKKKNQPKPIEELQKLVEPYRKSNGQADILVPFSGGRDSTYVLHVVKEELGLNPVAFTYDWGMVTDLARRNIARTCGKLGVENIIVAADIHWKRENIKKNIKAWLKNPALGMIPLFMAGDKFFFYYAHKVKKQLGIDLEIWGVNDLENTNFKTGFAGLPPQFDKKRIYSISLANQLKLFGFVGLNLLKSPGYINRSVIDSLGSFASRYITPKADYFHLFDYMQWDEKHIEKTLFAHYDWEKSVDTDSTWRIGDGTASFYNYIYTRVAGFSENDTFRSNQIREGMISREEALKLVYEENKPRYNSLKWYLEIIGLDYSDVINKLNNIPYRF
jgi:asparagine synthetase B (glutamine-hydrolysing)